LEVIGRVGFKITIEDFLVESEEVDFYSCTFTVDFILNMKYKSI